MVKRSRQLKRTTGLDYNDLAKREILKLRYSKSVPILHNGRHRPWSSNGAGRHHSARRLPKSSNSNESSKNNGSHSGYTASGSNSSKGHWKSSKASAPSPSQTLGLGRRSVSYDAHDWEYRVAESLFLAGSGQRSPGSAHSSIYVDPTSPADDDWNDLGLLDQLPLDDDADIYALDEEDESDSVVWVDASEHPPRAVDAKPPAIQIKHSSQANLVYLPTKAFTLWPDVQPKTVVLAVKHFTPTSAPRNSTSSTASLTGSDAYETPTSELDVPGDYKYLSLPLDFGQVPPRPNDVNFLPDRATRLRRLYDRRRSLPPPVAVTEPAGHESIEILHAGSDTRLDIMPTATATVAGRSSTPDLAEERATSYFHSNDSIPNRQTYLTESVRGPITSHPPGAGPSIWSLSTHRSDERALTKASSAAPSSAIPTWLPRPLQLVPPTAWFFLGGFILPPLWYVHRPPQQAQLIASSLRWIGCLYPTTVVDHRRPWYKRLLTASPPPVHLPPTPSEKARSDGGGWAFRDFAHHQGLLPDPDADADRLPGPKRLSNFLSDQVPAGEPSLTFWASQRSQSPRAGSWAGVRANVVCGRAGFHIWRLRCRVMSVLSVFILAYASAFARSVSKS